MSETAITFFSQQNYDCVQCAKGCHATWRVIVEPAVRESLRGSELELRVIQDGDQPFDESGDTILVGRTKTGQCVFLDPNKLCSIHRDLGYQAKPTACQSFPYQILDTPDGYVVGLSYFCTAAQQNHGRPLSEHRGEVEDLISKGQAIRVAHGPLVITGDHDLDWAGYKMLEAFLSEGVARDGVEITVGRALWSLCSELCQQPGRALTPERLHKVLSESQSGLMEQDGMISAQMEFFCYSLMAFMEATSIEELRDLNAGFLGDQEMSLARFGWKGTLLQIEDQRADKVGDQFDQHILRYVQALLHRKFLLLKRPILDNLGILYLLPRLLREYTAIASLGRGSDPGIDDYYRALDVCELDIATHTRGTERLFAALAESVYNQVAALLQ